VLVFASLSSVPNASKTPPEEDHLDDDTPIWDQPRQRPQPQNVSGFPETNQPQNVSSSYLERPPVHMAARPNNPSKSTMSERRHAERKDRDIKIRLAKERLEKIRQRKKMEEENRILDIDKQRLDQEVRTVDLCCFGFPLCVVATL
jgi:hypothetical protein